MEALLFVPVLLPILLGIPIMACRWETAKKRNRYTMLVVCANTLIVLLLLYLRPAETFDFYRITDEMSFSFRLDGLGMVFAGLVSVLWPLATLYAFAYMEEEEYQNMFFMFYTFTYSAVLGVAFAGNLITLYLFYEILTLVTVPLVIQPMTEKAKKAARKYLYYSLGGAAVGFITIVFLMSFGAGNEFAYGGILNLDSVGADKNLMLAIYVIGFCGFGVKAALFPFHSWLPSAGVAPTPVTALLHAAAVVKSGAFAIMRLTYFCFGASFVKGTWAQGIVLGLASFTILFGSAMAVKETHLKRRLAYSTVSNLSYILLGTTIMSPLGLIGALCHMVYHAVMKICGFFCAGAVLHKTGKNYVGELNGLGRKMPVTFFCFTVSGLALVGVPPLIGFVSKWELAKAVIDQGGFAFVGLAALFISAFLTAVYMLSVVIQAYFMKPVKENEKDVHGEAIRDPGWQMVFPILLFAAVMLLGAFFSNPLLAFFDKIAYGRI